MNKFQHQQLEGILTAERNRHRSVLNYSLMQTEELVIIWSYLITVRVFSILLVASGCSKARRKVISEQELNELFTLTEPPPFTREIIIRLAEWYYEPGLFMVFGKLMMEEPKVIGELRRIIEDHKILTELVLLPKSTGNEISVPLLNRLLRIDKLSSFSPRDRDYEAPDQRQKALLKTLELLKEQSEIKPWPLASFPIPLIPDMQEIWARDVAAAWNQEVTVNLGAIRGSLDLNDEILRQKVREHLRNFWSTTKRQREILQGKNEFPTDGPESWRAQWDWEESSQEQRQQEIKAELHPNSKEHSPDISARMFEVLKEAQRHKRWGPKAIKALTLYIQGKTEKEASVLAGIDPKTFRNDIARLKKIFSLKK